VSTSDIDAGIAASNGVGEHFAIATEVALTRLPEGWCEASEIDGGLGRGFPHGGACMGGGGGSRKRWKLGGCRGVLPTPSPSQRQCPRSLPSPS
jgi:hypothetical protein